MILPRSALLADVPATEAYFDFGMVPMHHTALLLAFYVYDSHAFASVVQRRSLHTGLRAMVPAICSI